jgi:hypothetical protein
MSQLKCSVCKVIKHPLMLFILGIYLYLFSSDDLEMQGFIVKLYVVITVFICFVFTLFLLTLALNE